MYYKTKLLSVGIICFLFSILLTGQIDVDSSISYTHQEKVSLKSKILKSMFPLFGIKKGRKMIEKIKNNDSSDEATLAPLSFERKYDIHESIVQSRRSWIIKPKENVSEKVILYLHGGTYVYNIKKYHWTFIEQLLVSTNATIVMPDYPLAPHSNSEDAIFFLSEVYQELLSIYPAENIILLGDSAGAGLSLSFTMALRNHSEPQPSQIILLSPWLDVTMSNKEIELIDKKDKVLGIQPLQMAGKSFAGDLSLQDFRISPLYGDYSNLGKISVFIGAHDMFLADCQILRKKLETDNIPMNYFEFPEMFHGWYIVPKLKESQLVFNQINLLVNHSY